MPSIPSSDNCLFIHYFVDILFQTVFPLLHSHLRQTDRMILEYQILRGGPGLPRGHGLRWGQLLPERQWRKQAE